MSRMALLLKMHPRFWNSVILSGTPRRISGSGRRSYNRDASRRTAQHDSFCWLGGFRIAAWHLVFLGAIGVSMTMAQTSAPAAPDFMKLWDYSDPAGTETKFRKLLADIEQSADRSYRLQLLTQIARTLGLQEEFADADVLLDDVERQLKDKDDPAARVRYLLERGRVRNSSGKPTDAMPLFEQAASLARDAKLSRLEVDAIHMAAIAAPDAKGRIDWNEKGIARAKELNETGWLVALNNNLGEEYRALKKYDKALTCFRAVQEAQKQQGKPVDRYARVDEAKMLRLMGKPQESLELMVQLRTEIKEDDGFVIEEIAESMLVLRPANDAKPLFVIAYDKLKDVKWLNASEPERLERLKSLAEQK